MRRIAACAGLYGDNNPSFSAELQLGTPVGFDSSSEGPASVRGVYFQYSDSDQWYEVWGVPGAHHHSRRVFDGPPHKLTIHSKTALDRGMRLCPHAQP